MKISICVTAVLAVLCGSNIVFSRNFPEYRNPIKLVNWKFYKGDVHSAESGGNISE